MPITKHKKTYKFYTDQIRVVHDSLYFKGAYGTFLGGESKGEGQNRYDRLREKLREDGTKEDIGYENYHTTSLSWREKRRVCRALRFTIEQQEFLITSELGERFRAEHAIARARKEWPCFNAEAITKEVEDSLGDSALVAGTILERLGYMNPQTRLEVFGLPQPE